MRKGMELVETITWTAGRTLTHQGRKLNLLAGYLLHFMATATVTGGAGAGTQHTDGLVRAFANTLGFRYNGANSLRLPGRTFAIISRLFWPKDFTQDPLSTLAAGTSESVEAFVYVPFEMPRSLDEGGTAFPANDPSVTSPALEIQTGAAGDMVYGEGAAVYALANAVVDVYEIPAEEGPEEAGRPRGVLLMSQQTHDIAASASAVKIRLDSVLRGYEIRAIIIEAESGGSSGADFIPNDSVLTYVAFNVDGTDKVKRTRAGALQQRNIRTYDVARETGVYVIDAAEDMKTWPGQLWDVTTDVKPYLEVDVTKQSGECRLLVTVIAVNGRR